MKIEDLEAFVAAVESETFFTPQGQPHRFESSASQHVLDLEKEFDTELFLREGDNTGILTEAGKTLLKEAKPLIRAYRHAMRKMDRFRPDYERTIIIGTLPILRQYRLNRVFTRFIDDHPDQDIRIEETEGTNLLQGLKEGYYDGIIARKSMLGDLDVNMIRLAADEMAAILWSDHPYASESSIRLEQLKNEEFYLTNPYTPAYGLCWKLLKDRHISTENVHTADVDQILPVVAQKRGVALLPISNLTVARQAGVTAVPLNPRATLEVVFAYPDNAAACGTMQELIDQLTNRSRQVPSV